MNLCTFIRAELENRKDRSAWDKGVNSYAFELVDELEEAIKYHGRNPLDYKELKEWCLNGADDWTVYSYSACSLWRDEDIAERLCTPSELKRTHGGELNPSSRETWLGLQGKALSSAYYRVRSAFFKIQKEN